MFQKKTLFVLGAGASCEVGLPTGSQLTEIIASKLKVEHEDYRGYSGPDGELGEAIRWKVQEVTSPGDELQNYYAAAFQITQAMPLEPSIDQFIDNHRGNKYIEFCGKLTIVESILEAERRSSIYTNYFASEYAPKYENLNETWYTPFIQYLCAGCHIDQLEDLFENVAFIVFNYDRCLEHILFHALQSKYGITDGHAADILSKLKIVHPYGSVGQLAWQEKEPEVPFGAKVTPSGLVSLCEGIKTFHERVKNKKATDEMRKLVFGAKNIVFLGFGFHPQNIDLIAPVSFKDTKRIYSSSIGLSDSIRSEIGNKLLALLTHGLGQMDTRPNATCYDVFQEFGRIFAE